MKGTTGLGRAAAFAGADAGAGAANADAAESATASATIVGRKRGMAGIVSDGGAA
jgi:hypothetical protein